jgi:hypothetical protein
MMLWGVVKTGGGAFASLACLARQHSDSEKDYLSQRREGAKFGVLFKGFLSDENL